MMDTLHTIERRVIVSRLRKMPSKGKVAESLGITLRTLYSKIHKLGLAGEFIYGHCEEVSNPSSVK